jgi:hypothetical protein
MRLLFKKFWKWAFVFVVASCEMSSQQHAESSEVNGVQAQEAPNPAIGDKPAELSQRFWDYYSSCKRDAYIEQFRKIVDLFNSGQLNVGEQIDAEAYENFKKYNKDYLGGKFGVAYVQEGEYGGEWIQLIFINKPDRVFKAWILHEKLVEFIDAEWPKEQIKKMQGDKEFLNAKYGF